MKQSTKLHLMGFSLLELLITIAVIAILASIAMPSYINYMEKARRADAMQSLENIRLEQEKWRRNNTTYTNVIANVGGAGSQEGYYNLSVSTVTSTAPVAYTATAAPVSGGAQANDDCGTFAINQDGPLTTGSFANDRCWRQ